MYRKCIGSVCRKWEELCVCVMCCAVKGGGRQRGLSGARGSLAFFLLLLLQLLLLLILLKSVGSAPKLPETRSTC